MGGAQKVVISSVACSKPKILRGDFTFCKE